MCIYSLHHLTDPGNNFLWCKFLLIAIKSTLREQKNQMTTQKAITVLRSTLKPTVFILPLIILITPWCSSYKNECLSNIKRRRNVWNRRESNNVNMKNSKSEWEMRYVTTINVNRKIIIINCSRYFHNFNYG